MSFLGIDLPEEVDTSGFELPSSFDTGSSYAPSTPSFGLDLSGLGSAPSAAPPTAIDLTPETETTPGTASSFLDSRILGPVLQTTLGLGGLLLGNKFQQDQAKAAQDQKKQDLLTALELEKLKYKYGLAGGGGGGKGGGGGGSGAAGKAAYLNAYGNFVQNTNAVNNQALNTLQSTGQGVASAFNHRVR